MPANDSLKNKMEGVQVTLDELLHLRHAIKTLKFKSLQYSMAEQLGEFVSRYHGRGIDFDETRVYQPGDDIRTMDWRVTARTGTPHIKLYRQERERPVFFIVDFSSSMLFGTRVAFKSVVAARAAATLAWAAAEQGDRVGGLVFSGHLTQEIKPQTRKKGVLQLCQCLVKQSTEETIQKNPNAFIQTLQRMKRLAKPGSIVFILSDFQHFDKKIKQYLSQIAHHNRCICIHVYDPIEKEAPPPNRYTITNGEQTHLLNTADKTTAVFYKQYFSEKKEALITFAKNYGLDLWSLATSDPLIPKINEFINRTS